jgi:hypothetical protein
MPRVARAAPARTSPHIWSNPWVRNEEESMKRSQAQIAELATPAAPTSRKPRDVGHPALPTKMCDVTAVTRVGRARREGFRVLSTIEPGSHHSVGS